ncbi:MAG: hypothetical protein GY917_07650 [Planctomycetaceae bacterium]|nr:hypothetical protein [Planctomycetaceae bacterium]
MNRMILCGVVAFVAFVGMALLGGENLVIAGHGCHGCSGAKKNGRKCNGATLTKERAAGKRRCHGSKRCSGSEPKAEGGGEIAPPPPKEARTLRLRRAPLRFYRVTYR